MTTPRTSYLRTPLSGSKNQLSFGSGRLNSSFLNTPPKRAFALASASPRNQSFNRSFTYSMLDETKRIVMYGLPMPVLVTEAITTAERSTDITVKLEGTGWASLVCGRRLFIWKYKQEPGVWNAAIHCRELTLPPSDLAHKAELVHVFMNPESQALSALAVSPEGIVRFWPNVVHEGSSVEATADLQGQECHSLTSIRSKSFILATTTGTLVLITLSATDGQHNILCHMLKVPQGVFAGIGRKVSSFIFGAIPTQTSESKQLNKVLSVCTTEEDSSFLYVLSSCTFQKWHLSKKEPDKLLYEHDFERILKEHFVKSLWTTTDSTQLNQLKCWCLDMQLMPNGVLILAAAMNINCSHFIHYAFVCLNTSDCTTGINFLSFSILKHTQVYQADSEEKLLSFRFLYLPNHRIAFVYSIDKAFLVSVADINLEQEILDVGGYGNILGAGVCEGLPLFFAHYTGVLAVQLNQTTFLNTSIQSTPPVRDVIMKEPQENESADNLISVLRSAMSLHFNNDIDKCRDMLSELMSDSSYLRMDSELDRAVIMLSNQIIDDFPVSDPRWCESVPTGDSVSSSLIILHQLDDKLKAHGYVISFLNAHGLFDRLSTVKINDTVTSTKLVLCEHEEKLIAAKAVRQFLVDYQEILDEVIKETLIVRNVELKNRLTYQDMFFREVSKIDTLFPSLIKWEERKLTDEVESAVNIIAPANTIFVGVLQAVLQYRFSKNTVYNLPDVNVDVPFLPWTSSEGPDGIRTALGHQLSINMQYTMKANENVHFQGTVYQQIVDIIDLLLDGYTVQLSSVQGDEHLTLDNCFKKVRNNAIRSLLDAGQYERAASLAEKYLDFDILVQLCEDTQNQERLQRYIIQFKEHDFSDFMFKWYLEKGMRNKLFMHRAGPQEELSRFLRGHDNLSWLHDINNHQYNFAQQTLKELALKETHYLSKKKTLTSLSKLSVLAGDMPQEIANNQIDLLNLELNLIAHQENLPDTVVDAFSLDPDTMRVLTPEELIEMYICDENTSANCYDFKIALELLHFIKKPSGDSELENLRRHIWCKAILRDNWAYLDTDNPVEAIKETIFFQVIELAFDQGIDLHDFIVSVEDLLQSSELSGLTECSNFIFLLRAGYEYVLKLIE